MSEKAKRKNDELWDSEYSKIAKFLKHDNFYSFFIMGLLTLCPVFTFLNFSLVPPLFSQFDFPLNLILGIPVFIIATMFIPALIITSIYLAGAKLVNFIDKLFIKGKRKRG